MEKYNMNLIKDPIMLRINKFTRTILFLFCSLFIMHGCEKGLSENAESSNTLKLDKTNITFPFAAESGYTVTVKAPEEPVYDITYNDESKDWLSAGLTGTGEQNTWQLTVKTTSENDTGANRSATITIAAGGEEMTINVTQEFSDPVIYLVDQKVTFTSKADVSAEVVFDIEADWTSELVFEEGDEPWVEMSVNGGTAGDNRKIGLKTLFENTSAVARRAELNIHYGSKTCTVDLTQDVGERVIDCATTEISFEYTSENSQNVVFTISKNWSIEIEYEEGDGSWLNVSKTAGVAGSNIEFSISTISANIKDVERTAVVKIVFENGYFPIEVSQGYVEGNLASHVDPVFLTLLVENKLLPSSEIVTQTDMSAIKKIDLKRSATDRGPLTSIKGVEYMSALQVLYCEYHQVKSVDLSKNTAMFDLRLDGNGLETINLTNCSKLDRIHLTYNNISEIELTDKPALRLIYLAENNLAELDLTGCNPDKVLGLTCGQNPGRDGKFVVKAWFDNSAIPANFTKASWLYGPEGEETEVELIYENAMGN